MNGLKTLTGLKANGFTLIEIIVAVAILAIISAIAIPSYRTYVLKATRAEGLANLLKIQAAYEEYYAQNNSYPAANTLPPSVATPIPSTTNYSYASVTATNTYTLTATATGNQASDSESGTSCTTLTIDNSSNQSPIVCWQP